MNSINIDHEYNFDKIFLLQESIVLRNTPEVFYI
jgi:hypothetical protein